MTKVRANYDKSLAKVERSGRLWAAGDEKGGRLRSAVGAVVSFLRSFLVMSLSSSLSIPSSLLLGQVHVACC